MIKLWFDKSAGLFLITDWVIDFREEFGHILVGWLFGLLIGWLGSQLHMLILGSHGANYLTKYNFSFNKRDKMSQDCKRKIRICCQIDCFLMV